MGIYGAVALMAGAASAAIGACKVGDLDLENRGCPCGTGYVCDVSRDVCVLPELLLDAAFFDAAPFDSGPPPCRGPDCACATDPDCTDPAYSKCAGGKCVACTSSPDACAIGSYCLPTNECAPGCKSNAECAALSPTAPFCNTTRHQCVECAASGDCKDAKQCSPGGACVTTCTGQGTTCPGGTTKCCNGLCIDTTSDVLNCNGCGTACPFGASSLCCAGACFDKLTSAGNCGKCGVACDSRTNATASSCAAGSCAFSCSPGFGHCAPGNTGCETSTTSNLVTACGSCTNNCNVNVKNATGITCMANTCGYTMCKPGFLELDGNTTNGCEACGSGGQACCPGSVCNGGSHCEVDGLCH